MSGSGFGQFIPLILIFVIFYFFLIRPQQKRIKDHKLMVGGLKRGDQVVTSGGIVGSIEKVHDDDKVDLLISENVTVQVIKSTIQNHLNDQKVKEHKLMVSALKRGDEVITSGGIVGKIERVLGDDKVDITIADNVTVQVVQSTIQSLSNKPAAKK